MTIVLVGGGPELSAAGRTALTPFLGACRTGGTVGVLLAGGRQEADAFSPAYLDLLRACCGEVRVMPLGDGIRGSDLRALDAVVVGGGPTPEYHRTLMPHHQLIRARVASGVPYLGFSAGAMIAARTAILGGNRSTGRVVCPAEWSEGLDDLTLAPGLDLVPFTVEVHTGQAGTLGRAVAAAQERPGITVKAIDEDTALVVTGDGVIVQGTGAVTQIHASTDGTATVRARHSHPSTDGPTP